MSALVIESYEELETYIGKELGYSDYLQISQEQINMFAEATLDHQWIHTDPERAAKDSPFNSTIAHGYLTVSVLPHLWQQIVHFKNVKLMVNYGIENLKFKDAVKVNDKIRMKATLADIKNLRGITKVNLKVAVEIQDSKNLALTANIILLYHFN